MRIQVDYRCYRLILIITANVSLTVEFVAPENVTTVAAHVFAVISQIININ